MKGFRVTGHRKAKLVQKLVKELEYLAKKGINTRFFVKKWLKIKHTNQLTTKQLTGILSQITEFKRTSL